ncbi:helix-turn-helix domain-containing protein [Calditrichota bacterium]
MKEEIGHKIRDLRSAAELTQVELAERAELTDGFISQVERGLTSISIDSLKQILDALNVSLSDFFTISEPQPVKFSQSDQVEIDEGGTGRLKLLIPGGTNRSFEPALLELEPGQASDIHTPFQGDTFGYILKGNVKLNALGRVYKLKAGESFYFTAESEHQLLNSSKNKAAVLWITSPPYF